MATSVDEPLDEDALQELYTWIDEIPLSRPKRNISRDFSDGVLVAEIVAHFLPKMVEMHNYTSANSQAQKLVNWKTLNRKVLSKLSYTVADNTVKDIVACKADVIEVILTILRSKIEKYLAKRKAESLRKNQQMYDEFSPDGPVSEHGNLFYEDGQAHGYTGPENNYGYAFNAAPPQDMGRYSGPYNSHQPQANMQPMEGNYYSQQSKPSEGGSPRGLNGRSKGKSDPRGSNLTSHQDKTKGLQPKGKVPRAQSYQDVNGTEQTNIRLALEEKEQALLASQETIQILQVKVRRLEHLLHLKDIRIDDLTKRLQQATQPPPRQLPPQQNPPQPPTFDGSPRAIQMHHQQPLPPVSHLHYQQQ